MPSSVTHNINNASTVILIIVDILKDNAVLKLLLKFFTTDGNETNSFYKRKLQK